LSVDSAVITLAHSRPPRTTPHDLRRVGVVRRLDHHADGIRYRNSGTTPVWRQSAHLRTAVSRRPRASASIALAPATADDSAIADTAAGCRRQPGEHRRPASPRRRRPIEREPSAARPYL